jgi:L,D-peptidoglycan transpeptidase YkuD (ErfK/YbiS/YcfS/YnhG family)
MDIQIQRFGNDGWHATLGEAGDWPCAIGRGGITDAKREGDGATPIGCWPLRRVLYRPDRLSQPDTQLPIAPLSPEDGWCDDPGHVAYNRQVRRPFSASHEALWRDDGIYDIIVILGHNDDPPVPGAGSAIFLHVARPHYGPTAGCVALALDDLLSVLRMVGPGDRLCVRADGTPHP